MKKLLFMIMLLPLSALAVQYECQPFEPPNVCTADGGLQDSYRQYKWDQDESVPINHHEFEEVAPDFLTKVRHKYWFFYSSTHNRNSAVGCSSQCEMVTECPFGQLPDINENCVDVEWGPYVCGQWTKGYVCDPVTGELTPEMEAAMNERGLLYLGAIYSTQRERLFLNNYAEYQFTWDQEGVPDMGVDMTYSCDQHCRLTDACEDDQGVDEWGICTPIGE